MNDLTLTTGRVELCLESGNYSLFKKASTFSVPHLGCFSIIKITAFKLIIVQSSLISYWVTTLGDMITITSVSVFRQMRVKFSLMQR